MKKEDKLSLIFFILISLIGLFFFDAADSITITPLRLLSYLAIGNAVGFATFYAHFRIRKYFKNKERGEP